MFYNGQEVANGTTSGVGSCAAGDGRIVVGRLYTNQDQAEDYASVEVDELIYFNATLISAQVQSIYKSA